jgi:hypothetical protein
MSEQTTIETTAQKLEAIGGRRWTKNGMDRMYFNGLAARVGLEYDTYKTGNICWAELNGRAISHAAARRILAALAELKVYVDLSTGELGHRGELDREGFAQTAIDSVAADVAAALAAEPETTTEDDSPEHTEATTETASYSVTVAPGGTYHCTCGHTVPVGRVLNANLGTSCPACYDRLS